MGKALVVVDPDVGISAAEFVSLWDSDDQALAVGPASVEVASASTYLPGVVELVVIPFAVNLATGVLYDLVARQVRRWRERSAAATEVEIVQTVSGNGDQVMVVRVRQGR